METFPNKENQHYVWRYYLKPWTTDGRLFCLRGERIFPTGTAVIANRNFFYETKELSKNELAFIEALITSQAVKPLQIIHRNLIRGFNAPFGLIKSLESNTEHLEAASKVRKWWEINSVEDFHMKVEGDSMQFLESLLKGKTDFYKDIDTRFEFLFFLSLQYMRTNNIKSRVLNGFNNRKELRDTMNDIWSLASLLFAINLADGMTRDKSRLILIDNRSTTPFITGDQPAVNILADEFDKDASFTKTEIYYPLSPKIAILVTDHERINSDVLALSEDDEIEFYNKHIYKASHEQIYADSAEVLEKLRDHSTNFISS